MRYEGRRYHRQPIANNDVRLSIMNIVFFLVGAVLVGRLFQLQVLRHGDYLEQSEKNHRVERTLMPVRGEIFIKEKDQLYPLVVNKEYYLAYAVPKEISDQVKFIDLVAPALGLSEEEWKDLLHRIGRVTDPYEPIRKKVEKSVKEALEAKLINGLYFTPETYRMYPEKNIGSHLVGFVDLDGAGQYGLEGYFNKELFGEYGAIKTVKDAQGQLVTVGERDVSPSIDGSDLILTVDRHIQQKACAEIQKGVALYEATGGHVIVMDPYTGAIIALCAFPDFDPENYGQTKDVNIFNNPAIFSAYEPGSIFKSLTMAIGLDTQKVTPESTYNDTGEVKIIGQKPIKNSDLQAHGITTMTKVLEKSLNTGAVHVAQLIGKDTFKRYVENFGFGERTDIQLDTEGAGNIAALDKRGDIYTYTASFGQGITVTSMQFITAFSSLINGGKLMRPHVVEKIMHSDGHAETIKPQAVRQVLKPLTSAMITGMMVSVAENGYDKKATIPGYYIGGKTGTAQVAGSDGKYGEDTIHTFVGFGPAYDPKFSIIVELNAPKRYNFSSETATHIFREIGKYILEYYHVPPERKIE